MVFFITLGGLGAKMIIWFGCSGFCVARRNCSVIIVQLSFTGMIFLAGLKIFPVRYFNAGVHIGHP